MQDGVQVYKCKVCGNRFRNKRREHLKEEREIWFDFVFKKQVHRELVEKYHFPLFQPSPRRTEKEFEKPRFMYLMPEFPIGAR